MVLLLTPVVFFGEICFFSSAEQAYLETREPILTLKKLSCRKYSFQKPDESHEKIIC
jgi:hypothetical protein